MYLNMSYAKQNELLLDKLTTYYKENSYKQMDNILTILNGQSKISLRIIDWFVTNYSKQHYTVYNLSSGVRFKVYNDYKLKLKAYSKKRFDPFCRWEKTIIPYNQSHIQTTIGQLNFFKWVLDNEIIKHIEDNYSAIEIDMNNRNSTSNLKTEKNKNKKKRKELSVSASKSIKKETIEISLTFN